MWLQLMLNRKKEGKFWKVVSSWGSCAYFSIACADTNWILTRPCGLVNKKGVMEYKQQKQRKLPFLVLRFYIYFFIYISWGLAANVDQMLLLINLEIKSVNENHQTLAWTPNNRNQIWNRKRNQICKWKPPEFDKNFQQYIMSRPRESLT